MQKHKFKYEKRFEFEAGGYLDGLELTYHSSAGSHEGRKVIWICHALTADSNPEAWWPDLAGPGKIFDTEKYFVICVNIIGSCYGSSGPTSINPKTGEPYYFDFPKITVRDIVKALNIVREHVGIEKIDLLIGASIGGFQALEYSIMYPELIKNAVYIATLSRVTPWLTAYEESQRMALEADSTFRSCKNIDGGKEGLKCARSIALLSYRSEYGYNIKQGEISDDVIFADRAASYQRHQGQKLAVRFDAYSYWYLSYSLDSQNIGRGRGGEEKALGMIKAASTVLAINGDLIFPPEKMKKMAGAIPGAVYHEISSPFGHDGFLLEKEQIENIINPILKLI